MLCLICLFPFVAKADSDYRLDVGSLTLDIYISKTANLFHAVDQIAQWSEFCHKQYVSYFQGLAGGMDKADRDFLARHAAIRKTHGWGRGLEQTFYTSLDLDAALALGVKEGLLSKEEAQTEREVLTHFQTRVERLMAEELPTLRKFAQGLQARRSDMTAFADVISQFVGGAKLTVPVYLMANPDERNCGGGFNGGRLTLEIAKNYDMYPTLLHELFHAFIRTKPGLIESAAKSVLGLDEETLSEGLAYAYNPGLVQAGNSGQADQLLSMVAGFMSSGSSLKNSYPRFSTYGLALRPLLKDALFGKRQTLETFLPRATDAWLVLTELDKARGAQSTSQSHDYRKDPRHSIFIFGIWDKPGLAALGSGNIIGRDHVEDQYQEQLTKNAKPGDTIILLLSLDAPSRVPDKFSDLLPLSWSETEAMLKQGQTVFRQSKARDMNIFLLATPSGEGLRNEFRRLGSEGKFTLGAGVSKTEPKKVVIATPQRSGDTSTTKREVKFTQGTTEFAEGDNIAITKILAKDGTFGKGDVITVKGTYTLTSRKKAQLMLSVTGTDDASKRPWPMPHKIIDAGTGDFEMTVTIPYEGFCHLSFYDLKTWKRCGTLYFGTRAQMESMPR